MPVTVQDVAALAGVSPGTVSNVLNHPTRVSEAVRQRVNRSIDQLGYSRNAAARQLRSGTSPTIGLIALDLHPFFVDLSRGAVAAAEEHGLSVLVASTDDSAHREAAYLDLFREQRVFGVLVSPTAKVGSRLHRMGDTPVVLLDQHGAGEFGSVSVDDLAGGRLAAQELLDIGRQRLLFVGGPTTVRQVADRLAGARLAVSTSERASLQVYETPNHTMAAGVEAARRLLDRDAPLPDAVFAATDLLALGLVQELIASGRVRVPADVAVVGYDDAPFAAASIVPLTTVHQPGEEIGRVATEMLVATRGRSDTTPQAINNVVFTPTLVRRESTRD